MSIVSKETMVFIAAWDGALSCMKIILFQNALFFFLYHGRKWSVRNSTYLVEVILTRSGTLTGPTISLPNISNQIITPPPPYWRRSLAGTGWIFTNHPELHPSGPSSVAWHSSVNMYVLWVTHKSFGSLMIFSEILLICHSHNNLEHGVMWQIKAK